MQIYSSTRWNFYNESDDQQSANVNVVRLTDNKINNQQIATRKKLTTELNSMG